MNQSIDSCASAPQRILRMCRPFFNDIGQRILTRNKHEQFQFFSRLFQKIGSKPGEKILDFGCGTGIFAKLLGSKGLGLNYVGYDVDKNLTKYGQWVYPSELFASHKEDVMKHGPYDYILANCCFHHIPEEQLTKELEFISSNLKRDGKFIVVDILAQRQESIIHKLFMMLEQGEYIRSYDDYVQLLQARYEVLHMETVRSHFISRRNPFIYNDLGVFVCQAYPG